MSVNVKLDSGGISSLLKSGGVQGLVAEAAEKVAGNVRGQGIMVDGRPGSVPLPVEVTTYTTDRAAASVALAHPAGAAVQAKHGALTKGASAAGISLNAR